MKQIDKLKMRIPYDELVFTTQNNYENVLNCLLEDTKYIALSTLYPFEDFAEYDLPEKYYNWQIRASVELYNLTGREGIISYSENGLSWTRDSGSLSKRLMNELVSKAGIIKNV